MRPKLIKKESPIIHVKIVDYKYIHINCFPVLEQLLRITKPFEEMLWKKLSMHDRSVYYAILYSFLVGFHRKTIIHGNKKLLLQMMHFRKAQ